MQPRAIPLIIPAPDIIAQLINRRVLQLQQKYTEFNQQFLQLQGRIKEHQENLKQHKSEMSPELFDRVMEELQLKQYKLDSNEPAQKGQKEYKSYRIGHAKDEIARESNRSSQITDLGFKPYNISNFKKELNHLKLKF